MASLEGLLKRLSGEYVEAEDSGAADISVPDDISELDGLAPEKPLTRDAPSVRLDAGAELPDKPAKKMTAAQTRKYVQDCVELMLEFFSWSWKLRDDYCGSVMEAQVSTVAARMTAIIMDHDDWVAWFVGSGGFMKWLMLATALKPVGEAIVAHHVFHTAGDDEETARARQERNDQYADF
jgi:hypothetical protein